MSDELTDDPSSEVGIVQNILDTSGENAALPEQEDSNIFESSPFGGDPTPAPAAIPVAPAAEPVDLGAPMELDPVPAAMPVETVPPAAPAEAFPAAAPVEAAVPATPAEAIPAAPVVEPPAATPAEDIQVVSADDFSSLGEAPPASPEPVAAEPVMAEAVVAEPVMAEAVVAEPVMAEPVVAEPVAADIPAANPIAGAPGNFDGETSDSSIDSLVDDIAVTDHLESAGDKVAFQAAKTKDGAEAIARARKVIESFDGEGGGFVDANELTAALMLLHDLLDRVDVLEARIAQLTSQ